MRPEPEAHQRTPSWLLPSGPDQVHGPAVTRTPEIRVKCGGEGGIRTLGTRKRTHAFQACSLSHSDTSPKCDLSQQFGWIDDPARKLVSQFPQKLPTDRDRYSCPPVPSGRRPGMRFHESRAPLRVQIRAVRQEER